MYHVGCRLTTQDAANSSRSGGRPIASARTARTRGTSDATIARTCGERGAPPTSPGLGDAHLRGGAQGAMGGGCGDLGAGAR
jgi:hypothetical protein